MSEPTTDEFSGHDLEKGVLQRVRQWRDAIPALALIDALRVAGSPIYVGFVWAALMLDAVSGGLSAIYLTAWDPFGFDSPATGVHRWLISGLSVVSAAILSALIGRAGACYAAGRAQSFLQNFRVVAGRCVWLVAILVTPAVFVAAFALILVVAGAIRRLGDAGEVLMEGATFLALPVAVMIGLIVAGSLLAVPLALVALAVEKQSDVFDSLSRGYEYVYRRPMHLAFYLACGSAMTGLVWILAYSIAFAGMAIGYFAIGIGAGVPADPGLFSLGLAMLPAAITMTAAWGLIGATYLLMRQAANQQELEDIAISDVDTAKPELPSLRG
jgi:hypothetical protein